MVKFSAVADITSGGATASASSRMATAARATDAGAGHSSSVASSGATTVHDTDCSTIGSVSVGSAGDAQSVAESVSS